RTPNGKVDRRALPVPTRERLETGEAFVAPSGPVEETLAALWSEVLGLDAIGVQDDFFDVGGDSLTAMQGAARLRRDVGVDLSHRVLFERPTVARLAVVVVEELARRAGAEDLDRLLADLEANEESP